MTSPSAAERLPCGRDPLDVVDHVRDGEADEHELSCPWCRDAVATADLAQSAARALVAAEPAVDPAATLLPNVMRTVWTELRRSSLVPLPSPDGPARVAEHVIGRLVEAALGELPELRVRTCAARVTSAESSLAHLEVTVDVAAAYGADVPVVTRRARELARAALSAQFGYEVDVVDFVVVDVFVA